MERGDECQIFDEDDEEKDMVFISRSIINEEYRLLEIELESSTFNIEETYPPVDFNEFNKLFSTNTTHSKFMMIIQLISVEVVLNSSTNLLHKRKLCHTKIR